MVLAMVLRNGVKSLQNAVSEALSWLGLGTASASAYSQARYKLKHTAFVELNRQAVVETLYGDGEYRRFWGFRVLGVRHHRLHGRQGQRGSRRVALGAGVGAVRRAEPGGAGRCAGAGRRLRGGPGGRAPGARREDDLLLFDRNYPAYRLLGTCVRAGRHFVARCLAASFAPARRMRL